MPLPKPPAKRAALLCAGRLRRAGPRLARRAATAADAAAGAPSRPRRRCSSCSNDRRPLPAAPPVRRPKAPAVAGARRRSGRRRAAPEPRRRKPRGNGPAKLFVLDTNVLMHDPMCLFRFEEHDIYLPMIMLEELDGHKKGMTEVARNARQVSRDARRARRRTCRRATSHGRSKASR